MDNEQEIVRQAHLSLRWETRGLWEPISEALGILTKPEHVSAIALALYAEATGCAREVSYSRRKAHYQTPKRYRSWLYTHNGVVRAVDRLEASGLIRNCVAEPGSRGWQSFMSPEADLIATVGGIVGNTLDLAPIREPILLRDQARSLIDYRDNRMTRRMRRQLCEQNEAIAQVDLSFAQGTSIDLQGHLRRIFNGDFSQGGRFYAQGGAWQTLPKAERLKLRIDGEPVVEVDYCEIHPVIAYSDCGYSYPGDAYDLPGYPRSLIKIAVAILLNSTSRNGARYTLAHKLEMAEFLIGEDCLRDGLQSKSCHGPATANPAYIQLAHSTAEAILDAVVTKHQPIRELFFTGAGTRLQYRDSEIAEAVMCAMRKRGITVLPVHDSFLVQASKADLLEDEMIHQAGRQSISVECKRSAIVSVG